MSENNNTKQFSKLCASFAIDVSGSTAGAILNVERNFISTVASKLENGLQASVLPWNHQAFAPTQLTYLPYLNSSGGTEPSVLLQQRSPQLGTLKQADLWFLLTDGEIGTYEVQKFGTSLSRQGLHGTPCVVVVFGRLHQPPANCNISVGFAPFGTTPHCLFLYCDVQSRNQNEVYLLQAKGCFESLIPANTSQPEITAATTWNDLPKLDLQNAFGELQVAEKQELAAEELSLGEGVTVNTNALYSDQSQVSDAYLYRILGNQRQQQSMAHTSHAQGTGGQFRTWLVSQQARPAPQAPAFQPSVSPNVAIQQIVGAMRTSRPRSEYSGLQQQVQQVWSQNRAIQQHQRRDGIIRQTLQRMDHADRGMYSADSLSAASTSSATEFDEGDSTDPKSAFRSECPICCQTDVVMSLLVIDDGGQTPAQRPMWPFPFAAGEIQQLNVVSSFLTCEQCAPHLTQSPHGEKIATSVPLVNYEKNRQFWKARLQKAGYLGRHFNEAQRECVFISALDNILCTKEWARPPNAMYKTPWLYPPQPVPAGGQDKTDNTMRCNALTFAVRTLLDSVAVPRNLKYADASGRPINLDFVPLRQALQSSLTEATTIPHNGVATNSTPLIYAPLHDSTIYANPITGFNLLLKICTYFKLLPSRTSSNPAQDDPTGFQKLEMLLLTKMMHHVTGRYMDIVLENRNNMDVPRSIIKDARWDPTNFDALAQKSLLSHPGHAFINALTRTSWRQAISTPKFIDTMKGMFDLLHDMDMVQMKGTPSETVQGLCSVGRRPTR